LHFFASHTFSVSLNDLLSEGFSALSDRFSISQYYYDGDIYLINGSADFPVSRILEQSIVFDESAIFHVSEVFNETEFLMMEVEPGLNEATIAAITTSVTGLSVGGAMGAVAARKCNVRISDIDIPDAIDMVDEEEESKKLRQSRGSDEEEEEKSDETDSEEEISEAKKKRNHESDVEHTERSKSDGVVTGQGEKVAIMYVPAQLPFALSSTNDRGQVKETSSANDSDEYYYSYSYYSDSDSLEQLPALGISSIIYVFDQQSRQ
jgi:hypothetical protein